MRCCRTVARSTCYSDDSPSLSQYVTKALLRQNSNPLGEGKSSQRLLNQSTGCSRLVTDRAGAKCDRNSAKCIMTSRR